MDQCILITRPQPEADAFAAELAEMGLKTLVSPMLSMAPLPYCVPELENFDALLVTSPRALEFFGGKGRMMPVYCVGAETAKFAQRLGYDRVHRAEGTGRDLARRICERYQGQSRRFLHVRGEDVAFDMRDALELAGLTLTPLAVYKAEFIKTFTPEAIAGFQECAIAAVVFFSKRTAENFLGLARRDGLDLDPIKALCVSEKVLEYVHSCGWREAYVSESPDAAAMKTLIKTLMTDYI